MRDLLRSPLTRLAAILAVGSLFVVLSLGITLLAQQAFRDITSLNTAKSDNLQWTLAQTEVEFLSFYNALAKVDGGQTMELPSLRRWFDIFYSRIETIRTGKLYRQLTERDRLKPAFAHINDFLAETAVLMDGTDQDLLRAVPQIAIKATPLRADIRAISLEGIRIFSKVSDTQRESISATMLRIASLTIGLIVLLLLGVIWLSRLYRFGRAQTRETQQTRDRLQAMLNTSLDAVLVVDRDGRFIEFNGAARDIFGYTQAETLGQDMTELIFPKHLIQAHLDGMRRHLDTGAARMIGNGRVQVEARRKSGEVFPAELSIAKTVSPQGEIFVSYLRDISDRREAEEKLLLARDEALAGERAKSRFIAVMSHEMRTPLNGLLGSLDLLKSTTLDARQAQYAEMMQRSGELLLHHVNDVLDISRLEGGKIGSDLSDVDLNALVGDVVQSQSALAQAKGLDLRFSPSSAVESITTSAIGLRQILLNLVNNAIKFTEKGSVRIDAAVTQDGARLRLTVRDTGAGISATDQARIFDDFVTLDSSFGRKADGTGLGLGIARRLAQAMGGEIGVDSQPKMGSRFWLEIPYLAAQPMPGQKRKPAKPAAKSASKPPRPLDILIVEDNQINRFILREMLAAEGHRVTEAQDGLVGLEKAGEQRFDLIFMDISMPRLDGIAATVRLRAGTGSSAGAPIVALTAHALPEDRALFLASGMNAVLTKPLDRKLLLQVLAEMVKSAKSIKEVVKMPGADKNPALINGAFDELVAVLGAQRAADLGKRYLDEGAQALPRIAQLFDTGDFATSQGAVHSFAGSCATFGAVGMQALLAGMESDLKLGRFESARAALPRLNLLWEATQVEIRARLA